MRVCLLALALCLGVAESVALDKAVAHGEKVGKSETTVSTKVFAYSGFKAATGTLSMSVSTNGVQLSDAEWNEMRTQHWKNLDDESSPLAQLGYNAWRPTKDGIVFRNREGGEVECAADQGRSHATESAVKVGFNCQYAGVNNAFVESQSKSEAEAPESGDFAGYLDRDDYDDNQKGELWVPAEDGVPYGWNKLFKSFGFPYFTVTPKGYLGCYKLQHGMCTMTPTSFATTQLQPRIKTPEGPPERFDLSPKFPHGTEYVDYTDLRTNMEDVKGMWDSPKPLPGGVAPPHSE